MSVGDWLHKTFARDAPTPPRDDAERHTGAAPREHAPTPAHGPAPEIALTPAVPPRPPVAPSVTATPAGYVQAVGESHCQVGLRRALRAHPDRRLSVTISTEADNDHDAHACEIVDPQHDARLGYLSHHLARQIHERLAQVGATPVNAMLTGGEPDGPMVELLIDEAGLRAALGVLPAE